jgi:hypothetical protein
MMNAEVVEDQKHLLASAPAIGHPGRFIAQ